MDAAGEPAAGHALLDGSRDRTWDRRLAAFPVIAAQVRGGLLNYRPDYR